MATLQYKTAALKDVQYEVMMAISHFKSNKTQGHWVTRAMRHHSAALPLLLGMLVLPEVDASELLYIFAPDCAACQQFDEEVLSYYDKADEARRLPIIKIRLSDWQAGIHVKSACKTQPVQVTPTFVALLNCEEQDRIVGYSQEELFWMALHRIDASMAGAASSVSTNKP